MPAVPTPVRRRSSSRPLALTGTVAAGLALAAAAPAAADTARIVGVGDRDLADVSLVTEADRAKESGASARPSRDARIVVTAADGRTRQLGPFRLPAPVSGLTASPDGRFLLLGTDAGNDDTAGIDLYALPLAGGVPQRLDLPRGAVPTPLSTPSFTPDGAELLLGDVATVSPTADPDRPTASDVTYASYRCALATGACTVLPVGSGGVHVGFPGGVLSASSVLSLSADALQTLVAIDELGADAWLPRSGRAARRLRTVLATPVPTAVTTHGVAPRTISDVRRTLAQGVPVAFSGVGGPSGALVARATVRTTLRRRGETIRPSTTISGPRLLVVRLDGTSTLGPVPRVTVPRSALRHVGRRYASARPALPFAAALDRGDGVWIGTAGDPGLAVGGASSPSRDDAPAVVLATLDAQRAARAVRVGGRPATVELLLRDVPRAGRIRATGPLEVLGYERATRSAVVRLQWWAARGLARERWTARTAVLRVPLDGAGRPTVLTGGVQTAW